MHRPAVHTFVFGVFAEWLDLMLKLSIFAGAATSVVAAGATCQCDAGDYWCSRDDTLRVNFNCSGQNSTIGLWDKIQNEDDPTPEDCANIESRCLQQPATASNATCDDECYRWAWVKDVGDCADDDDSQTFCVSLAQEWCVAHKCGAKNPWDSNKCAHVCSEQFMDVREDEINFIDYSNCMRKCTPAKSSPWG